MKARGQRTSDTFLINGSKTYISGVDMADYAQQRRVFNDNADWGLSEDRAPAHPFA